MSDNIPLTASIRSFRIVQRKDTRPYFDIIVNNIRNGITKLEINHD